MSKEAMKLALEALEGLEALLLSMGLTHLIVYGDAEKAITNLQKQLEEQPAQQWNAGVPPLYPEPEPGVSIKATYEQPAQQEPVAWRPVPTKPTEEMLKAMDECSTEGYDERLYAGHAASVYMAAVDAAPTPPAQRKPLTLREIGATCGNFSKETIKIVRQTEAAHNIKENT